MRAFPRTEGLSGPDDPVSPGNIMVNLRWLPSGKGWAAAVPTQDFMSVLAEANVACNSKVRSRDWAQAKGIIASGYDTVALQVNPALILELGVSACLAGAPGRALRNAIKRALKRRGAAKLMIIRDGGEIIVAVAEGHGGQPR